MRRRSCSIVGSKRYGEDWDDEQEEVIWGRIVSFRRHLLGVVREAEITKVLGAPKQTRREELKAEDKLVRDGRARVRDVIVNERKRRSLENAQMSAAALEDSRPACRRRTIGLPL
jgi:hypothetical protein